MLNLVLENEAVLLAGRRARWRLAWAAAGTAACMLFVVVLATLIDLVDFGKPADTGSSEALIPGNLASFVEWLRAFAPLMLAPLLAWRIVHGRTLKSFRLHGHGRHWSWFWRSAAAGLLVFGFANLAELIIHGDRFAAVPRGFDFLPWFTLGLAVILFQSMSEEVLFKGYLLRAWGAVFPQRWLVAMVLLVLFIALHWSNDDFSRDRGLAVLDFVLSGIVSYLVFFRTNSIAAATGLHFANNVASGDVRSGL